MEGGKETFAVKFSSQVLIFCQKWVKQGETQGGLKAIHTTKSWLADSKSRATHVGEDMEG